MTRPARDPRDTHEQRKARGAFFTPPALAEFLVEWAVREASDVVLEPSTGDAEFLVHAVRRLRNLGAESPRVFGSEVHPWSAAEGERRVREAGGEAEILVGDFFERPVEAVHDAVIGNPPYIRFQEFTGAQRARARAAALRGGVHLSGLASAWAAFTVTAALHLRDGGRLAFVLPAELLTANYAGPVRRFLFENFAAIELIVFEERVFPEAETEALLLLASGYRAGSSSSAQIRQVRNAGELATLPPARTYTPSAPESKWAGITLDAGATTALVQAVTDGDLVPLSSWGDTRLGAVTGRNTYFAMSPAEVDAAGIAPTETLPLSPPGSGHLRGLDLSAEALAELGRRGRRTLLFRPGEGVQSEGALAYLRQGLAEGVDQTYKSRSRRVWWQVPILPPPDLFLTYMNADTVRLVTNSARAHHLNSVHGVYLSPELAALGARLLPLASLNSYTMLSAELTGRAYGGGLLKMEPGEATRWLVPSPATVEAACTALTGVQKDVEAALRSKRREEAVGLVDAALLRDSLGVAQDVIDGVRTARQELAARREARSRGSH